MSLCLFFVAHWYWSITLVSIPPIRIIIQPLSWRSQPKFQCLLLIQPLWKARHAYFYFSFRRRPRLYGVRPGSRNMLLGYLLLHQPRWSWSLPAATLEGLFDCLLLWGIDLSCWVHQPHGWLSLRLL
ncbi:hypothetical protein LX36DRAFT_189263 [Colletotrichum falcatum]|nr:hypothetical protein LX36DRAFT_189263 [Colletotrichum falcatum]